MILKIHGEGNQHWGRVMGVAYAVHLNGEPTLALLYEDIERDCPGAREFKKWIVDQGIQPTVPVNVPSWLTPEGVPDEWEVKGIIENIVLCELRNG